MPRVCAGSRRPPEVVQVGGVFEPLRQDQYAEGGGRGGGSRRIQVSVVQLAYLFRKLL